MPILERLVMALFPAFELALIVKCATRFIACTTERMLWMLIITGTCVGSGVAAPSGKDLLAALNQGDTVAAQRLVRSRAPVNVTDDLGSSALMYAAMYADLA